MALSGRGMVRAPPAGAAARLRALAAVAGGFAIGWGPAAAMAGRRAEAASLRPAFAAAALASAVAFGCYRRAAATGGRGVRRDAALALAAGHTGLVAGLADVPWRAFGVPTWALFVAAHALAFATPAALGRRAGGPRALDELEATLVACAAALAVAGGVAAAFGRAAWAPAWPARGACALGAACALAACARDLGRASWLRRAFDGRVPGWSVVPLADRPGEPPPVEEGPPAYVGAAGPPGAVLVATDGEAGARSPYRAPSPSDDAVATLPADVGRAARTLRRRAAAAAALAAAQIGLAIASGPAAAVAGAASAGPRRPAGVPPFRRATRYEPARVPNVVDAVELATGAAHGCARERRGGVWCWGQNDQGQLGDGTWVGRGAPVPAAAGPDVLGLAPGDFHSCATFAGGALRCWGRNDYGQLGHVGPPSAAAPLDPVRLPEGVVQAAGALSHACARLASGDVWCWGQRAPDWAERGAPRDARPYAPARVARLGPAEQIAVGNAFDCARLRDGGVACWGKLAPLLGHAAPDDGGPATLAAFEHAVELAVGDWRVCARFANATHVRCLGDERWGSPPRPVEHYVPDAAGVALGRAHGCGRTGAGDVFCWGENDRGQLGDGTTDRAAFPRRVPGLPPVAQVVARGDHTCARSSRGDVWCWGADQL